MRRPEQLGLLPADRPSLRRALEFVGEPGEQIIIVRCALEGGRPRMRIEQAPQVAEADRELHVAFPEHLREPGARFAVQRLRLVPARPPMEGDGGRAAYFVASGRITRLRPPPQPEAKGAGKARDAELLAPGEAPAGRVDVAGELARLRKELAR